MENESVAPLISRSSLSEQAYEATRIADGVIQGASVVRRLMEEGPDSVGVYVSEVRASIDRV